jgi:hypothetical protein
MPEIVKTIQMFTKISKFMMQSDVVRIRCYLEITKSVVESIAVNVMNMFGRVKPSSKMLFHYQTMFENSPTVNLHFLVSLPIDVSRTAFSIFRHVWATVDSVAHVVHVAKESCADRFLAALNTAISLSGRVWSTLLQLSRITAISLPAVVVALAPSASVELPFAARNLANLHLGIL